MSQNYGNSNNPLDGLYDATGIPPVSVLIDMIQGELLTLENRVDSVDTFVCGDPRCGETSLSKDPLNLQDRLANILQSIQRISNTSDRTLTHLGV